MEDAREAWIDVAGKVESLGLKLKLHLEQEAADEVDDRVEGETSTAFDELTGKVNDAFDAFGNAARDENVLSDVREIADLIREALVETFRAVGAEVGGLMEQIEDYAEKAADAIGGSGDASSDDVIEVSEVQDTVIPDDGPASDA